MKIKSVLCVVLMVMIYSCTYDKPELAAPEKPDSCDTTASVTYTNYVKAVLTTNCTLNGCHDAGAPAGYDYSTYAAIKAKVNNGTFQNRVLGIKDMPSVVSAGPTHLDDCTILKLEKWINNNAPQ